MNRDRYQARRNRRAEREWQKAKNQLSGDHPHWFDYIDY